MTTEKKLPEPITKEEANYLLIKLDAPSVIPIDGHQDRNNMSLVCNKLVQIVNFVPPKPDDKEES